MPSSLLVFEHLFFNLYLIQRFPALMRIRSAKIDNTLNKDGEGEKSGMHIQSENRGGTEGLLFGWSASPLCL